jgi:parvulin-like peptidyl-prolyl isomerase
MRKPRKLSRVSTLQIATKRVADQEFDCDEAIVLPDSDRTDSQGRIRIRVRPGETYRARCVPFKGYVDWSANNSEVHIPAGVDRFDLPPIELARTCVIKGRLVDTDSRAIAGVRIRGSRCSFGEHEKKPAVEVDHWTTTDSSGSFQFDDLAAGTTVTLLPVRSAVALTELVSVVAGADKPIQLQAKKEQLVALTGRVVGADHNPIANARVAIEAANSPDPSAVLTLSLDANGLFQTPAQFPARFRYRLSVRSMLDNVASTEWICPACSGARFPDLIVDRERVAIDAPLTGKEIVGRVDNHPIYAEELLALYCTEPLSNARSLLLARKDLSDFRITKQEYRSLQDEAIKRHLADIVRVRVLTGALLAQLDAQERGRLEEVVAKEFQEYVEKLKGDFQVTSPNEVDHELKRQETSLAKLRTEFRYRLLARECLRLESPDSDAVWDEALAYYQAHRDAYATQQKVNWQLLEINFDMGRTVTAAVAIGAKARREQHGSHNDSKEAETPVKDSILSGTLLSGTQGKMDASRSESPPGAFQLGKLSIGSTFFSSIPPDPEKEVQKAEEKIGELLKSAAAFGEHISPEEARTLMDAALKELRQRKVFEDVAKKFSDGAMAKDGGWQPTTNPDSIVDEKTTDALRRLPEGATSAVIQTKHSLRIIRVVSRVPAGCQSFEEVQESIREHIRHAGQQKKVADIFSRTPIESAYPAEETSQSPLLSE